MVKTGFWCKIHPEMYQRVMDEMLLGIDYVYTILDDILIAGPEVAHHDLVLETVPQPPAKF